MDTNMINDIEFAKVVSHPKEYLGNLKEIIFEVPLIRANTIN